MARSAGEIQADIALTRKLVEQDVDAIRSRLARRRWAPYVVGGVVLAGILLAKTPVARFAGAGVRLIRVGLGVVVAVATVERLLRPRGPR